MKDIDLLERRILILVLLLASLATNACRTNRIEKPEALNQPLPPFLHFVAPEPESVYSVEAYKRGEHYPQQVHPAPQDAEHRVCAKIVARPLLEPGDFFAEYPDEGELFPDRVSAYVDGAAVEKDEEIIAFLGEGSSLIDEDGKEIAFAPGPHVICWEVHFTPGKHWAMIEIERTSGEMVRYAWSFELAN